MKYYHPTWSWLAILALLLLTGCGNSSSSAPSLGVPGQLTMVFIYTEG